jgi:hypothetical protein
LVDCSLSDDDFPIKWTAGDTYSVLWLLDLLASSEEPPLPASIQVTWSRAGSTLSSTTTLPLPHFESMRSQLEHYATVSHPPTTRLYHPTLFRYTIANPHATKPLHLSVAVESSPDWVLSTPRTINRLVVLPGSSHTLTFSGVPISRLGALDAPRVRISQLLPADPLLDEASDAAVRTRELPILPEGMVWTDRTAAEVHDEHGAVRRLAQIVVLP